MTTTRLALLLLLAACAGEPAAVEFDTFITADLNGALAVSIAEPLPPSTDVPLDIPIGEPAMARMLYGRTACLPTGGINPMVYLPPARRPRVGQPYSIVFATRAGGGPDDVAVLVQSHRPAVPIDFTPYGAPGCWLLVNTDASLVLPTAGGLSTWTWAPPSWATGVHLWVQLVVFAPGQNRAGAIGSPAVELIAGQW